MVSSSSGGHSAKPSARETCSAKHNLFKGGYANDYPSLLFSSPSLQYPPVRVDYKDSTKPGKHEGPAPGSPSFFGRAITWNSSSRSLHLSPSLQWSHPPQIQTKCRFSRSSLTLIKKGALEPVSPSTGPGFFIRISWFPKSQEE